MQKHIKHCTAVHSIPTGDAIFDVELVWHQSIAAILMPICSHFFVMAFDKRSLQYYR